MPLPLKVLNNNPHFREDAPRDDKEHYQLEIPKDNSSFLYSIALSMLLPTLTDKESFNEIFLHLFGKKAKNHQDTFFYWLSLYDGTEIFLKKHPDSYIFEELVNIYFRKNLVTFIEKYEYMFESEFQYHGIDRKLYCENLSQPDSYVGKRIDIEIMLQFLRRVFVIQAEYDKGYICRPSYPSRITPLHFSTEKILDSEEEKYYYSCFVEKQYLLTPSEKIENFLNSDASSRLRDYQKESLRQFATALEEGKKRGYIVLPTGCGKSWLIYYAATILNLKTLIVTSTKNLVHDIANKFDELSNEEIKPTLVRSKNKDKNGKIIVGQFNVCCYPTLSKLGNAGEKFDLIILDEGHRALTKNYIDTLEKLAIYALFLLAFTATVTGFAPSGVTTRLLNGSKLHLKEVFENELFTYPFMEAVEQKYLSPIRNIEIYIKDARFDLSSLRMKNKKGEDFNQHELEKILDNHAINDVFLKLLLTQKDALTNKPFFEGQNIVFCCSVRHAESLAKFINNKLQELPYFKDKNITPAVAISGKTKDNETIIKKFKDKEIYILIGCKIFREGFDCKEVDSAFIIAPTTSELLLIQEAGRVTRPNKDEHATVVTFVFSGIEDLQVRGVQIMEGRHTLGKVKQHEDTSEFDAFKDIVAHDTIEYEVNCEPAINTYNELVKKRHERKRKIIDKDSPNKKNPMGIEKPIFSVTSQNATPFFFEPFKNTTLVLPINPNDQIQHNIQPKAIQSDAIHSPKDSTYKKTENIGNVIGSILQNSMDVEKTDLNEIAVDKFFTEKEIEELFDYMEDEEKKNTRSFK